jgi:hypothetical protein
MEKRIKLGKYEFPESEWSNVSDEAKSLIDEMLETAPERRLTIDKVMRSKWILNYVDAPKKKLNSIKIMNQDSKNWAEMIDSMGQALNELRVNYEQDIKLKEINDVRTKNPLLRKRLIKKLQQQNILGSTIVESELESIVENSVNTKTDEKVKTIPQNLRFENEPSSPVSALYYSTGINFSNEKMNEKSDKQ